MSHGAATASAARHLHALLRVGRTGPRLGTDCRPLTPEEGWQIQRRVSALRATPELGWKCGLPPGDRWVVAALHEIRSGGTRLRAPAGPKGLPRIEPELGFVLGHDLPARDAPYTPAEVDAAIGATRMAVEVLGCRYDHPEQVTGPELMADGLWHQTLVLGPLIEQAVPPQWTLEVEVDGEPVSQCVARHPNGDPRLPLYWLAEFLRQQGIGLRQGQCVITGSLAGLLTPRFGREVVLRYGDMGHLALTIDPL